MRRVLGQDFYSNEDVLAISQQLLGKVLVTNIDNYLTSGIIVETEAYNGVSDKASHAYNNRRTNRTETMYHKGGVAYVYLCYGIHHLFNVVTGCKDVPQAVLVRAIEPLDGISIMLKRRKKQASHKLTAGPGIMTAALGITKQLDGQRLNRTTPIWVEDRGMIVASSDILASPRIGIDYAAEHKDLPWRFQLKNNPFVSKP